MSQLDDRKTSLLIFTSLLMIFLLFTSFRVDSGDGEFMFKVADNLAMGKGLAISVTPETADRYGPWGRLEPVDIFQGGDGYGAWGKDSRYYAKYGLGWSLVAAPFCFLGRQITPYVQGFTSEYVARAAVMTLNPILTACTAVVLYLLGRRFYDKNIAINLVILYSFGTIAWYYAKSAFSEPLVTLLILLAILLIYKSNYVLAGAALGFALLTRQTVIFLVLLILVWVGYDLKRTYTTRKALQVLCLLILVLIGQMAVFGYNFYRFGDAFNYGYLTAQWNTDFLLGLSSILFSPGKGLFVFTPLVILGVLGSLMRPRQEIGLLILIMSISFLIPHAFYSDWGGGGGWGSRLLLPVIPLLLIPAGVVIRDWQKGKFTRFLLVGIFSISIFIQVLGISVNWTRHLQRIYSSSSNPEQYFQRVHYVWRDSPIPGQLQSLREVVSIYRDPQARTGLIDMVQTVREKGNPDWQVEAQYRLSLNLPDFWWIYRGFLLTR